MEDSRGSCCPDPLAASGGAAQADHRDQERHAGPSGGEVSHTVSVCLCVYHESFWKLNSSLQRCVCCTGPLARLPQHCDQRLRVAAALPGLSEGGEVWRSHLEGNRTSDGSV